MLVSGIQQSDSVIHISILYEIPFPFRLLQNIEQSSACYIVGPYWLSIFNICVLSRSVMSDSLRPYGLWPARLLWLWGFSRQEYWNGLPHPLPRGLPNPMLKPMSPVLPVGSLPSVSPGKLISLIF